MFGDLWLRMNEVTRIISSMSDEELLMFCAMGGKMPRGRPMLARRVVNMLDKLRDEVTPKLTLRERSVRSPVAVKRKAAA